MKIQKMHSYKHDQNSRIVSALRKASLVCLALLMTLFMPASSARVYGEETSTTENYNFYQHRFFPINTTLNCEKTTSAAFTADGMMWIGTYDGVYRFDGQDMIQMDFGNVHAVNCLFTDDNDRLWIGTNDNGIVVVKDENVISSVQKKDGLLSDTISSLCEDEEGNILAATSNGLQQLELASDEKEIHVTEEMSSVEMPVSLAFDDSHKTAVTDADGFLTLLQNDEAADVKVPDDAYQFTAAVFGKDELLYAGRDDGHIDVFDVSQGSLDQVKELDAGRSAAVNSLTFVDDTLFVCTEEGTAYLDGDSFVWVRADDFNGASGSVIEDFQGNLWVTSQRLGLLELYRSPAAALFQSYGLGKVGVNSEMEWNGLLYFGTDAGLKCLNPLTWKSVDNELTQSIANVPVQCLLKDSKGNLWICTFGDGIVVVKADGSQTVINYDNGLFNDKVRMAIELKDGTIAACGNDGLSLVESDGTIVQSLVRATGNSPVLCLLEREDGTLLAGTDGDGISAIRDGEVIDTWTKEDGLPSDTVRRLSESPASGKMYAVTNNGICLVNENDGNYDFSEIKNLPDVNSYNVRILDDGMTLIPGSDGVYVLQEEDLFSDNSEPEYLLLNDEWGISTALTVDACNYIDDAMNFYLGTTQGVYMVNLNDYDKSQLDYRLRINSISVDGTKQEAGENDTFRIGNDVRRISIQPELINYNVTDPEVSYYLEGYDKETRTVRYSQLQEITYTGLPGGKYTLHVSVLDSHQQKQAVLECTLIKDKALSDYGWFRILILFILLAAVSLIVWVISTVRFHQKLKKQQEKQKEELLIREKQVETANEGVVAIARALDARDRYTSQHSARVSAYSALIGKAMGMPEEECENLRKVALLHDIGKIGVPDRILNKPGKLTDEEYAIIKKHVDYGGEILKNFTGLDHAVEGARYHHERYDGKGYTQGLKGEEIPLYGRIIGVADAFDAMTSNRVYRGHLDINDVLAELERCKGTQFDPKIADIMIQLVKDGKVDLSELYADTEKKKS